MSTAEPVNTLGILTSKNQSQWLMFNEAGAVLGVTKRTVPRYIQLGWIHPITIPGRKKRITGRELERFLALAAANELPHGSIRVR